MKTQKAYALFTLKDGMLFSQYVKNTQPNPIGEWLEAKDDARRVTKDNGRDYVWGGKLGWLAWRCGKHLATLPLFDHIGVRQPDGTLKRRRDSVICEVEYVADVDYRALCVERSKAMHNGKLVERDACLDRLPIDGFYIYKTNTQAKVDWIICHKFRINRILSEEEVVEICEANGLKAQEVA